MRFSVLRADASGRVFESLDAASIVREGMQFSFTDRGVEPGETYRYRVDVSDEDGAWTLFETGALTAPAPGFALHQNHPNPFNPSTTIRFTIPERCNVALDVYDASGRLVTRLADGVREAGTHSVEWNGRDVGSGVYFCRLTAGKQVLSRKMTLLR
jgi:hypothetical protein